MGYTTEFEGQIAIEPPLNAEEVAYLTKFSDTRRMDCHQGPYYVDGGNGFDQNPHVIDYNRPPACQPGLWCNWIPTEDGKFIEWNGTEKFYHAEEWMRYLAQHFIGENPIARETGQVPFLQCHTLNGEIQAQGEDHSDKWTLIVKDNAVSVQDFVFSTPKVTCPHCEEEFYLEQAK